MKYFAKIRERWGLIVNRVNESIDLRWAIFIGFVERCCSSVQTKFKNCRHHTRVFFNRCRTNLVEQVARICACFIDFRHAIRMRLDEIFQSRMIRMQTERPVRIQAEMQKEATWMFFRTNHPVITTEHLTFNGSRMQLKKQTPMVRALFRIPGVAEVALMRYNVRVTRGSLFPVDKLTPKIMAVLREHLV